MSQRNHNIEHIYILYTLRYYHYYLFLYLHVVNNQVIAAIALDFLTDKM